MNPKKLRLKMTEMDETAATLESKTGVGRTRISHLMHHDRDIRVSTLKKLCKGLKCKAEDLW